MKILVVAGITLCLAALGGCTRGERTDVDQGVRSFGANVEHATENAALAAKVKIALATRKDLKGTKIHVQASGSGVTLKGDVNTRQQAAEAEKVAQGTAGVSSVSNQLALRVPVAEKGSSR